MSKLGHDYIYEAHQRLECPKLYVGPLGITAYDTPAGLSPHPGKWSIERDEWTVFHSIRHQDGTHSNSNRIDKYTSGIMMGGPYPALSYLRSNWTRFRKQYLCVLAAPDWDEEYVDQLVLGKPCATKFTVLKRQDGLALVLAELMQSGRNHQIRRHAKYLGFPMADDMIYKGGPRLGLRRGQLLHCHKMTLILPDESKVTVVSPTPKDWPDGLGSEGDASALTASAI